MAAQKSGTSIDSQDSHTFGPEAQEMENMCVDVVFPNGQKKLYHIFLNNTVSQTKIGIIEEFNDAENGSIDPGAHDLILKPKGLRLDDEAETMLYYKYALTECSRIVVHPKGMPFVADNAHHAVAGGIKMKTGH